MNIKDKLPGVKEDILLAAYTTFKIGGPAKYFFIAEDKNDLIKAIKVAKEFNLPFFILGGGSNLLISDKGYKGLVIKLQAESYKLQAKNIIYVDAGIFLGKIVKLVSDNSLAGLEWAAGIPGTIGAAVYGNVGAFGFAMENNVESVDALDIRNLKIKSFSDKECRFGSKDSVFKKNKNLIILSVLLKLKNGEKEKIQKEIKNFLDYRKKNHPLNFPSAGCVFKNYNGKIKNKKLLRKFSELYDFNKSGRIPTSYLIDKCGLKGKVIGGAKISEKHANFIVNLGGAKAKDVIKLIKVIKQKVKAEFGIELEEEIQHLA